MTFETMMAHVSGRNGFIAALDQSGGSTPEALRLYGVPDASYRSDDEMFSIMHDMRVRVMTAPSFRGDKIIGAILFEDTLDRTVANSSVPGFLWRERQVVPFLKVDKGREEEVDGVKLMRPMPDLDALLGRAKAQGVFGTKMRSVIRLPSKAGIRRAVEQQFEVAARISAYGLMPIIEPEVLIASPDKPAAEAILKEELTRGLGSLGHGRKVMLKLTIPDVPDLYRNLTENERVLCLVALSGGYDQADACARLAENHGVIASFSRALLENLQRDMPDADFNATLSRSIDAIYAASVHKRDL